jgi:spore germination cell wall hydrolase CwlJ-like protein
MTGPPRRLTRPRRLWLGVAVLAVAAMGLGSALLLRSPQSGARAAADEAPPPPPDNLAALLALTADARSMVAQADAARAANAALPLVAGGLQAARPFELPSGIDLPGADRALQCLALTMYYEAGFEGPGGRLAVAQVVLNRVRHPAYPNTVCGVVFQRSAGQVCQFTFACDGAMRRPPVPALWQQTRAEAAAALGGQIYAPVGMATHYHADYVYPNWAPRLEKIAVVGTHLFYRWPDGWGLRRAFTAAHAGAEPEIPGLELPLAEPEATAIPLPAELAGAAAEVAPVRGENEGGFVDPAKGWVPRIALPKGSATPPPAGQPSDTARP